MNIQQTTERVLQSLKSPLVQGGILTSMLAITLAGVLWYVAQVPTQEVPPLMVQKGTLMLTLGRDDAGVPHRLNISTGELMAHESQDGIALREAVTAPQGGKIAYVCATARYNSAICLFDTSTNGQTVISKNSLAEKRSLAWSHDGMWLTYTARTEESIAAEDTDSSGWRVFLVRADGSEEILVSEGVSPFFSIDGESLFMLKKDGLYELGLQSGIERNIYSLGVGAAMHSRMDAALSPDGTKFAWTNPYTTDGKGSVALFEVTQAPTFKVTLAQHMPFKAEQVLFSPDSTEFALLALSGVEGQAPRIVTSRVNGEGGAPFASRLVVEGYAAGAVALTGWVQ